MELQIIKDKIYEIRASRVLLDSDLAALYGVKTRMLKQAVRRNINRFPDDFMFELSQDEWQALRSQNVTSTRGGNRYPPFAFTEQGVAMLSSVLNSDKAIEVNISIMRAFVMLRQHLADYANLKEQVALLEQEMNIKFKDIYQALNYLLNKDKTNMEQEQRERIGFKTDAKKNT